MKGFLSSVLSGALVVAALSSAPGSCGAQPTPSNPLWVPVANRGRIDQERSGFHDHNRIQTVFWNYGMVGDYPTDPQKVDLSVFHSAEVPKGSGMNYTDGITPFVLAKVKQQDGQTAYIWETGYRERQGISPWYNRAMRFEPRPGFFQADPRVNKGRSPALSNDPRTWPDSWPDKQGDPDDPGWAGSWNGYFGKRAAADQESFTVMDDDYYDAWFYYPDQSDAFLTNDSYRKPDSLRRHGLGLRIEVRGFQWANPQAGNVIFWHYDITNEGTTDYDDNVVFGLYMDAGVGGSQLSCDGIYESDDDNAFFDRSLGMNLVYTWDRYGHGVDLAGTCSPTGYLGYAYLETPGNPYDRVDNDNDGITDERRDSLDVAADSVVGQDDIRAYARARYDFAKFEQFYGPIEKRPAYRVGKWWPADEDMDWNPETDDVGADGLPGTNDAGESDGRPDWGEPNFNKTDVDESDQIGLTGFKMNRIRQGQGNPDPNVDNIWFFDDNNHWPQRMYDYFTNPDFPARFDSALASNYNIAFLFASGPFQLKAGQHERFSLALAYGANLPELRENVRTVQQIYNANYQFAEAPAQPTVKAETGDGYVRLSWDDVAERSLDPVSHQYDFEGYRVYRATDPEFRDAQTISTGTGTGPMAGNGRPIAQFDVVDGRAGFSRKAIDGVAYWLGEDTGLKHAWIDTTVTNGQQYYYAVTAYDYGYEPTDGSPDIYPSENAIAVSRTPRGGLLLPPNAVAVRPNVRVQGFARAAVDSVAHVAGRGRGSVEVQVVTSPEVPEDHHFKITFSAPGPDSIRATAYSLTDSTADTLLFETGTDFRGEGSGPVGFGLLPVIRMDSVTTVDRVATGFAAGSQSDDSLLASYVTILSANRRRLGYPADVTITFDDVVRDTSEELPASGLFANPAKFVVVAHTDTGDVRLPFAFDDFDGDGTLSKKQEAIYVMCPAPVVADSQITWQVQVIQKGGLDPAHPPRLGDAYHIRLIQPFGAADEFTFTTRGETLGPEVAAGFAEPPYVVPNPYVGSASFEPSRFAVSGRGERRMEFRAIPRGGEVRIYTVKGELVRRLVQDGSADGYAPWDLRTRDNLDVAPGLYLFHVQSPGGATFVGKFAILK